MINRRAFLFALAYGGVSNALWSQSRIDTARQFVASTQKYAEDLGRALADQDMINIALKVLIRADEVGNAFRAYDKIHGAIIVSLENQVGALLQAPTLLKGDRKELSDRYNTLKLTIRERYEASWVPTNLDSAKRDLAEAFTNAAKELTELAKMGRAPTQQEIENSNLQQIPAYVVPHQDEHRFDCVFFASSPAMSTDAGSGGNTSSSTSGGPPQQGGTGFYILSCPGPEGDNTWIDISNIFGQAASITWIGALYSGPVGVVFLIVTLVLAAVALITGGIGILVRGDQIAEETREINEAEMYKFLHSALPSDIVKAYQKRATANVALLSKAAEEVKVFLNGTAEERAHLLSPHEANRKSEAAYGKRLQDLNAAKCRINSRKSTKVPTVGQQCPVDTGPNAAKQAADDEKLVKSEQAAFTLERLWQFVRFQMIDVLITGSTARTQEQERRTWQQVDQLIEKEFMKLMSSIDLVSDIAEIDNKAINDQMTMELRNIHQYSLLRSRFSTLVGDAIRTAYGDMNQDIYRQEVERFQASLDGFMTGDGASSSVGVNLQHALVLLKQRSL